MKKADQSFKNMRQVLEDLEQKLAGRNVIHYLEGEQAKGITGEKLFRDIKEAAGMIRYKGKEGKHIGIIGKNSYEWIVSLCAVFWTGSIAVLLDRESSPEKLEYLISKADVDALICDDEAEKTFKETRCQEGNSAAAMWKMKDRINGYGDEKSEKIMRQPDELACIFFTSGTTGGSKAVMMSEHGLAAGICHKINDRRFKRMLAILPFHHLSGFTAVLNTLYLGAEVCVAEDVKYFYKYLEILKPDYAFLVPSMLRMLARKLNNGGKNGKNLGWNLQMINCGGAAFCSEVLQNFIEHGIAVFQGYGASEAGAIGFMWEMTLERPDTIGKPPAALEVKIENGELYLRSESVMMGYYKDQEGTDSVLKDGWYATGDLCRIDEGGYLYLIGRKKNLIILGNGENISPEEIEERLYRYKDICEVLVAAEEEMLVALIFPRYPENCSKECREQIQERIRKNVFQYNEREAVYRQIKKIDFLEKPIEKTVNGKVIRYRDVKSQP